MNSDIYSAKLASEGSDLKLEEEVDLEEEKYFGGLIDVVKATLCQLKDTSPIGSYWLTVAIIIVNVIIAIATGGVLFINPLIAYMYHPSSLCLMSGRCFLELIFSMFSHAHIFHLIGNMFFFYVFGDNLEITLGRLKYLLVYFASGVVAAYVHALITLAFNPNAIHIPMIGASGAISGILGGYVILYPGAATCWCIGWRFIFKCFKIKAATYITLWILLQFLYAITFPFIAIWAHLGGFFTGLVLTYLLVDRKKIEIIRRELAVGYYRGLKPRIEELMKYSLSEKSKWLISALALILLIGLALSMYTVLLSFPGYYAVYLELSKSCKWVYCEQHFKQPLRCYCSDCIISLSKAYYEHFSKRPENISLNATIIDLDDIPCPPQSVTMLLRIYDLNNARLVSSLVMIIFTVLAVLTLHVVLKGYKEVEVTYVKPYLRNNQKLKKSKNSITYDLQ